MLTFEVGPHGDGTLTIHRSKTDQEGHGSVRYLAGDTVRAVRDWLEASRVTEGALFRALGAE